MREPERIKRILNLIEEIWTRYPDLRFNQLVSWLQYEFINKCKYPRINGTVDLFYVEDGKFEEFLKRHLEELK